MTAVGAQTHSMADRGLDFYPTPPQAIQALIKAEGKHRLPYWLWEPACGDGAIVLPLREAGFKVIASDIVDRGCPDSFVNDFLGSHKYTYSPGRYEGVVTNPPFKHAQAFVDRALETVDYVAILARLAFLEGVGRKRWFEKEHLARVHVSSRRLPMMHRDGWDGPKATSSIAFAWFVWDRDEERKPTELTWFDWKDGGVE